MSTQRLDSTGRPVGGPRDASSPLFTEEEFEAKVMRPLRDARSGSAVSGIDFAGAVSEEGADVQAVVRESRVLGVLEDLDRDLVGLAPVKQRIREIAALLVIDRLREQMGLVSQHPTLHMSFTGSPGTGKTTVALRMAAILYRLGYVERGHLVSVTRDDLVGQYVGHTAPKTKDIVKRALGGILFIDEAYYLHRTDNERDYGQEAIEILLQEMEAERENFVVILAGYRDRMEEFFQANPGMGSRVAHHIHFPDYQADELLQIARLMVAQQGYELSEEATDALRQYIARRLERPRFAHGRSIRNAVERARLRQASRLFDADRRLTRADLLTLEAQDILQSSVFDDVTEQAADGAGAGVAAGATPEAS